MPLDFSKDIPPPTLGKRPRAASAYVVDDVEVGLTRDDITMGLRTMGGTMKVKSNPWDIEKQERYKAHYTSQESLEAHEKTREAEGLASRPSFYPDDQDDPHADKIAEYLDYWARASSTSITPGWLPQNYVPFRMKAAQRLAKDLQSARSNGYRQWADTDLERVRHNWPRVEITIRDKDPVEIRVSASVVRNNGSVEKLVIRHLLSDRDIVDMLHTSMFVEHLFRTINAMIVKVGIRQMEFERQQRKARYGPIDGLMAF